jgi:hypothetical protein
MFSPSKLIVMQELSTIEQKTNHDMEGKLVAFLFDKLNEGDTFVKAERLLREQRFSEDEINYARNNFPQVLDSCIESHKIVQEEINRFQEKSANFSFGFNVISGFLYIIVGIGILGYFSGSLMEQTVFFSIFLMLFGGYKIYSGLQTR